MLFKKKKKEEIKIQKDQQQARKSIQELIPIKEINQGLLFTPDLKVVQCLRVSAVNLELTSIAEANELFDIFEGFLTSLNYDVQFTNVSMPVDLSLYIQDQEKIYKETKNHYKRSLQNSYIKYAKNIENSQDIMQRQRYVIFTEKMKDDTDQSKYETLLEVIEKRDEIITALSELELTAEPVTDLEIIRYFHTLFDYSGAQNRPINNSDVVQVIEGGKRNVEITN